MIRGNLHSKIIFHLVFLIPIVLLLLVNPACAPLTQDQPSATAPVQVKGTQVPGNPSTETAPPETITSTPLPTASPLPALTSTPIPYVVITGNTNCRFGPDSVYDWLYTYLAGDQAQLLGKNADESFWFTTDQNGVIPDCWLWGNYATPVGDTSSLPVFTPPPTPTPRPDFEISYSDYDGAGGDAWLWFKIENTGSVKWESALVYAKNTATGDTAVHLSNTFKDGVWGGSDITDVAAGYSGFIPSGQLFKPFGYMIDVYLLACEKDDLGGLCQARYLSIDLTTP